MPVTAFDRFLDALNAVLWHDSVLVLLLLTGVVFTVWSRFAQGLVLTHGWSVVRGVPSRAILEGSGTLRTYYDGGQFAYLDSQRERLAVAIGSSMDGSGRNIV